MNGLSFLNNISLAANSAVVKAPVSRTAIVRNPDKADIRVYKNGAIYPSLALVEEFGLEYVGKSVEAKGMGFDVFTSKSFLNTQHLEDSFIMIAAVPRSLPKVDLFGSCTYDAQGNPRTSVADQGASTFGVQLLEMITAMYGVSIGADEKYIDLIIARENPIPSTPDNIYWLPKTVSKGEKKGDTEMVKRMNLQLFALVPRVLMDGVGAEKFSDEELEKDKLASSKVVESDEPRDVAFVGVAAMETEDDEPENEQPAVLGVTEDFEIEEVDENEAEGHEIQESFESPSFMED